MLKRISEASSTAQKFKLNILRYKHLSLIHISQMDCLSVFFVSQYAVLFITLSIVVTYALKVDLKV